ncbi:hypothetical protein NIES4071_71340 [Calothrix sp. NIES-4071]|nr:hypothetical protein NIES4071_71340 [Calothrix sp. NIES-4071]BAZ61409.1 hypothetical protein NIES4105_71290 [Calothrix sp. NIES-4105]
MMESGVKIPGYTLLVSIIMNSTEKRLEQYTIKLPKLVLVITALVDGELDSITVFKGFSSSLVRGTPFDPDVPVLPDDANILSIDIVASPYNPEAPLYIEQGLSWEVMQTRLFDVGV